MVEDAASTIGGFLDWIGRRYPNLTRVQYIRCPIKPILKPLRWVTFKPLADRVGAERRCGAFMQAGIYSSPASSILAVDRLPEQATAPSVQLRTKRLEVPALDRVKGEWQSPCGPSTLDPVFEERPDDVDSIRNGADGVSFRKKPARAAPTPPSGRDTPSNAASGPGISELEAKKRRIHRVNCSTFIAPYGLRHKLGFKGHLDIHMLNDDACFGRSVALHPTAVQRGLPLWISHCGAGRSHSAADVSLRRKGDHRWVPSELFAQGRADARSQDKRDDPLGEWLKGRSVSASCSLPEAFRLPPRH
ncbi:hypothetical protein VTO73DRAFT_10252 [Trametes versicolor]